MKERDISFTKGHRQRLREKYLAGKATDEEKFELLLTYAIPRIDVKPLAKKLVHECGGTYNAICTPFDNLCKIPGIKENTATLISLINDLLLVGYKGKMKDRPVFHDYKSLQDYCLTMLSEKSVEEFHVLYLDKSLQLIEDEIHSSGTIDWSAVYPREILKKVLSHNAKSIILLHNHPGGRTSFSTDDIEITKEIMDKLKSIDVDVMDHLLVSGTVLYSAKNLMLLK